MNDGYNYQKILYNNFESHKMSATRIPSKYLWRERWLVLGYVGVKSGQSSSFGPRPPNEKLLPRPLNVCICKQSAR